jgi:micrococcal nuclease
MRLTILILLFITQLVNAQMRGRVINVHDGDTFTLLMADSTTRVVRLAMIDCPELHQPYGYQAWQYTNRSIYNKIVTVDSLKQDRYHRTIGVVYLPKGDTLNIKLLRDGYAWQYIKYDTDVYRATLEATARADKRGLWQLPIAPWEWRRMSKE